jgi:hypothetical protein
VPQGGWYNVQTRDSATPTFVSTFGKVGVGALVAVLGQSNAHQWFRNGDSSLAPHALLRVHGNIASWAVPATASMNAAIACGNAIAATLGLPVALLDYAWDGSGMIMSNSGGQWVPLSSNAYVAFKTGVSAFAAKLEGAIWVQGETEAKLYDSSLVQADYYTGLTTLFNGIRTDFGAGIPIAIALHARRLDGTTPDAGIEGVRLAQATKAAEANTYRVERTDIEMYSDGIHHTAAGFSVLGARCAQAINYALGVAMYYRGPHVSGANRAGANTINVRLAHGGGNDITPSSGITGWRVMDGATPVAVSTAVRLSATQVQLTLAGTPGAGLTVEYLYGATPTITGIVKDNSSLTLPLEFTGPVSAPVAATSVTFSVVDETGAAVTASGLDYAFFEQSRLSQLVAPVKTGTNLAIAGGAVTLDISGVTTLAPGATGYIRWGDAAGVKSGGGPVVVA